MASRMLHYVIAVEVAKEYEIENMNDFIVGALLPDASMHSDGSYNWAHFGFRKTEPTKGIDWLEFIKKYDMKNELNLGYLCHLIADAVWFKEITDKYIRIYPLEEKKQRIKRGYRDFWKLNAILIEEYELEKPKLYIPEFPVDEINVEKIEEVYSWFEKDFDEAGEYKADDLEIYPYESVKVFIGECKRLCLHEFSALKNGTELTNPREYFVPTVR
ncbi:MAG: hypothetical protein IKB01_05245 [Lachnospiraceae bacterium]|nr:hypothetical protein [Lachnospiraceae bacterium]